MMSGGVLTSRGQRVWPCIGQLPWGEGDVREESAVDIRLKRAYDPAVSSDGYRVLIDRLWPHGVSRERAKLDEWERKLPPSTKLRQWFGHEPARFEEFRRR
jgi:uncharacterized protein DUF488